MRKKNIFRIILILLPFIILALLELTLRLFGYDNDLKIVSTIERNGKNYYTMNQLVGKRYFGKERLYYRKGSHDFFEVNKQPNTIRVFCFGASTMAGFPYEYNAIPSEFLRDRLTYAFPHKNIEVINTAIAATNSFTVVQFAEKLVHYKPDLFIVYMGQNEFYGVYGVGSTISIGKSRWMINTYLWFEQFKTFLLLKDFISTITNWIKPNNSGENKILMEQMAKNNSIGLNSDDYKTAVNTFRENYKEVIEIAKNNNIPIIISTLVTNDGLKPFVSMHSQNLKDSLKTKWEMYLDQGNEKMSKALSVKNFFDSTKKKEYYSEAIADFSKAESIDSLPAIVHYNTGKCYEELGDYKKAQQQLSQAVDLDGLRFRAPSEFNNVIIKLSHEFKVPLTDVREEFKEKSPHGIIGGNLLVDHVHPNIKGYFLMAKSWFATILNNKLFGVSQVKVENDSILWNESSVTYLDSLIGKLKIRELRNRPPFQKIEEPFDFEPKNFVEKIAYQYVVKHKLSWGNAHLEVAKEYFSKSDFTNALRELKAVLITDEDNPNILKLVGDMCFNLKLFSKAESYYLKAFSLTNNHFIEFKLGLTEYYLGKPSLSIQYLNDCLEHNKYGAQKFNPKEVTDIYYNLALAYTQVSEYDKAKNSLHAMLNINPEDKRVAEMIRQINSLTK